MTIDSTLAVGHGRRWGWTTTAALAVAVGWGLLLLASAAALPMYDSESASSSSDGTSTVVTSGTATAVEVNGWGIAILFGVPLLVALAVSVALWFRERRAALPIAWTLTGALGVLNLLALLTIGVFVLPVTVALIVACGTSGRAATTPIAEPAAAAG